MIRTLAVERYRSLDELVLGLDRLTVVTGANGSGKTSVYRVLRLLADIVRDGAISSLAREGGMRSALHAGPRPKGPVAVRLGVATEDLSYAIDLGLPQLGAFRLDPEIKSEVVWSGPVLRPSTMLTERVGMRVRSRDDDGTWRDAPLAVSQHESVMAVLADPAATPDLFALREQARRWRFYDHLRTDADAPARRPGVATFTPVLSHGGDDLAAALLTILLLLAACLATRAPDLLVLNEPESSLHPSLMPAVGALVASASERSQVLVVTHSGDLVRALRAAGSTTVELSKNGASTTVAGRDRFDGPPWSWPKR